MISESVNKFVDIDRTVLQKQELLPSLVPNALLT